MTGVRPFEAPTDLEILLRVQKAEFRPPEEAPPDMPPELAQIMMRAMRMDPADRYQSADEMLADVERVMRTVFPPVGPDRAQALADRAAARDGVAPISQSSAPAARTTSVRSKTGTGELEEEDVVLLDTDEEVIDGEEATSLAVVKGGEISRPRATRARATLPDLPVPEDAESMSNLSGRSELALPIPEEEGGRPGRRRARRGSGFSILFVGALLVAGAWFAGKYARTYLPTWFGAGVTANSAGSARRARTVRRPPAITPGPNRLRARCRPTSRRLLRETQRRRPRRAESAEAPAPARHAEPAAAHEAGHEAAPRRRGGAKDFVGRDLAGLKMAPDPSLLPAPSPPSAPKTADSPPAAPPASETP